MVRWILVICMAVSCLTAEANEGLTLTGIIQGERPTAIINDHIVAVGDSVEGMIILEIKNQSVIAQGTNGPVELFLNSSLSVNGQTNSQSKSRSGEAQSAIAGPGANLSQATDDQKNVHARQLLDRSVAILKEADTLLQSPLAFEKLYSKAAYLCDQAENEAQQAFRLVRDDAFRLAVKQHIDRVRQAKETILREKANLNTHMRTLIADHQIKTGMTMRDVTSSWGPPLMRNRDGQLEKWIYQDNNGNQKELVFREDILIAY